MRGEIQDLDNFLCVTTFRHAVWDESVEIVT
jgi:hypothetical protein